MLPKKQPKPSVALQPVKGSSAITATGFDPATGILAVEFKGGKTYHYQGVTPATWEQMGKAESLGKFVAANVVGKFDLFKPEA